MAGEPPASTGEPETTMGCGSGGREAAADEDDDEEVPWALLAD